MPPTNLTIQLAARIIEIIRVEGAPAGARLVERVLAEQLRVSRSPIRSALKFLENDGVVEKTSTGGFIVRDTNSNLIHKVEQNSDEAQYIQIAEDRLSGKLPDRITENQLIRRYHLTASQLKTILRRIASEGWIERLPGHGWEFLPMLTSMQSYEDSYRFRLTIEPAAILEPGFVLNAANLNECRKQQEKLIEGEIWSISNSKLFDLNSHLHECIIECSHNLFFIDSLKRIDRLRRLFEYRQTLDREKALIRCKEHIELIDLLLEGKLKQASAFLRRHLLSVSAEKTIEKRGAAQ